MQSLGMGRVLIDRALVEGVIFKCQAKEIFKRPFPSFLYSSHPHWPSYCSKNIKYASASGPFHLLSLCIINFLFFFFQFLLKNHFLKSNFLLSWSFYLRVQTYSNIFSHASLASSLIFCILGLFSIFKYFWIFISPLKCKLNENGNS